MRSPRRPHASLAALILLLLLLLPACLSEPVVTETEPPPDLSGHASYAWLGSMGAEAPDPELDAEVRAAVAKSLQVLGLQEAAAEETGLGVGYHARVEKTIRNNDPYYFLYAAEEWEVGTLTIELLEGDTPFWSGSATSDLRRSRVSVGTVNPRMRATDEERRWHADRKVAAILAALHR